jgi:hypothetical protein
MIVGLVLDVLKKIGAKLLRGSRLDGRRGV